MYISNLLLDQMRFGVYKANYIEDNLNGKPDTRIVLEPVPGNGEVDETVTIGWASKMLIKDCAKYANALNDVYFNKGFK